MIRDGQRLRERWLERALEEEFRDLRPPDVRHRVLNTTPRERVAAARRAGATHATATATFSVRLRRFPTAAAAAVMFAATVVLTVFLHTARPPADDSISSRVIDDEGQELGLGGRIALDQPSIGKQDRSSQDRGKQDRGKQDRGKLVKPNSLAELRALVKTARELIVEVHDLEQVSRSQMATQLIPHGRRLIVGDELATWRTALDASLVTEQSTDTIGNCLEIELVLADDRRCEFELFIGPKPRINTRIAKLEMVLMSDAVLELAQLEVESARQRSRWRRGIATSLAELTKIDSQSTHLTAPLLAISTLDSVSLPKLRSLDLTAPESVDRRLLGQLAKSKTTARLRALALPAGKLGDADLAPLAQLAALRELELRDASDEFTGRGLRALRHHRMTSLRLVRCPGLTAASLVEITRWTSLRELTLIEPSHEIVSALPQVLTSLPSLVELSVHRADQIGADFFAALSRTKLRHLDLTRCSEVDGDGLGRLATLPTMRKLNLYHVLIDSGTVAKIAGIRTLVELELTMTGAPRPAVAELRRQLPACNVRFLGRWRRGNGKK